MLGGAPLPSGDWRNARGSCALRPTDEGRAFFARLGVEVARRRDPV